MAAITSPDQSYETVIGYKISDLMLVVMIEEISRVKGKKFIRTDSFDMLRAGLGEKNLLVCDLIVVSSDLDLLKKISSERKSTIFGYYPHVDKDIETLARSTGIDYVVPRSALQAKLRLLLT